ncbi:hypothetical protein ACQCN2_07155 [Brevibacillus ginsengisoli]|uniref:hypothetical protein n=1 Tax=Brevibacillus ginsengisoli TaxID=363854 RepID=UPI003CE68C87
MAKRLDRLEKFLTGNLQISDKQLPLSKEARDILTRPVQLPSASKADKSDGKGNA